MNHVILNNEIHINIMNTYIERFIFDINIDIFLFLMYDSFTFDYGVS